MASYVSGIDVGHMAIRAVVLKKTGSGWKLHEHGSVSRFYGSSGEKTLNQELAELSTLVQLRGPVYVTDSTMNVMTRFISSVPLPPERLRRLVHLELEQHADDSGDLAADMYVLPIGGDEVICCCALAQPRQVSDLLAVLKANTIDAEAVTLPAAAMYNVSRRSFDDQEECHRLIIDIGAEATRLILMRGNAFLGCRSLPLGGRQFTEALAASHGRQFAEAEKIKVSGHAAHAASPSYNQSLAADGDTRATAMPSFDDSDADSSGISNDSRADNSGSDLFDDDSGVFDDQPPSLDDDLSFTAFDEDAISTDDLQDDVAVDAEEPAATGEMEQDQAANTASEPAAEAGLVVFDDEDPTVSKPGNQTMQIGADQLGQEMLQVAEQLHMQIRSSLKWFNAQIHRSHLEIDEMFIVGGGAQLSGLRLYLEHRLGKPLSPLDPLQDIDCERVPEEAQYVRAIGAALQSEEDALHYDVRPESVLLKEAWKREVIWPRIAAGALLVAGIVFAIAMHLRQLDNLDAEKIYKNHEETRQDQMVQLNELRRERDALFEDLRGITGRIYAGRDLLNAIRAFKEEAPRDLWIITMRTEGIVDEKANGGGNQDRRNDTAIDRGRLYVYGRMQTQKNTDVSVYQDQFDSWYKNVYEWTDSAGNRLFNKSNVERFYQLKPEDDPEEPYIFEIRYDFQPTTLKDAARRTGVIKETENAP